MTTLPNLGRVADLGRSQIHGRPDYWTTLGRITGASMSLDFTSPSITSTLAACGFTFSRADAVSCATYIDSSGVMQVAAANVLRQTHDPATLAPLGFLVEESSTNSVRNGDAVGAVAGSPGTMPTHWQAVLNGLSREVVGFGIESGMPYVDVRVYGTATSATQQIRLEQYAATVAVAGQVWTTSCYRRFVGGALTNVTSVDVGVTFRGAGGAELSSRSTSGLPTADGLLAQRSSHSLSAPASTAFVEPFININVVNGATVDVTIRLGGAQCEPRAFATSYIATSGTARTRQSDALMTTALAAMGYSATAGTVVVRSRALGFSAASSPAPYLFGVGSLSSNELSVYFDGSARKTVGEARSGGAVQMSMSAAEVIAAGASYISALAWAENDAALVVNGGTPVTDTSIVLPVGIDRVSIGGRQARGQTGVGSQIISRLDYYNRRLSNAELQSITT